MVMTVKPDMTKIWAATGATAVPPDVKIASGWGYEMMPFEWENWIQNRNDSMLSHINQRGIPEWDAASEYFANKSYATGSNGLVYAALVDNTNVNPVSDVTGKWVRAFPSITGGGASGTWAISVSGNAATATQFATARTINGVSFNGTADIIVEPYVERDDATNAVRYLSFVDSSAAGHQRLNMGLNLTYNPSTNTISTSVTGNSGTATKWATARSISITGDATWTTSIDGSANATGVLTLANSGVTAGTYNNVATAVTPITVDAKGRVTAAGAAVTITPAFSNVTGKPTTLSGYGITDAAPSSHVGSTGASHGVATTSVAGFMSAADKTKLDGVSAPGGSALVGFQQAGAGAVATTVQQQLRKTVYLSNYIPEGTNTATTDCTPYVQAAVDATPSGGTLIVDVVGTVLLDTVYSKYVTILGTARHACAVLINKPMKLRGSPSCIFKIKDFSSAWSQMVLSDLIGAFLVNSSGVEIDGLYVDANADNHYEVDGDGFKWWELGPTNKRPPNGIVVLPTKNAPNITNVMIQNCVVDRPLAGVVFQGNMESEINSAFLTRTRTTGTVEGCVARNNTVKRHRGNGILMVAGVTACLSERNRMVNGMYHATRFYSAVVDSVSVGDVDFVDCAAVVARYNSTDNGYWRTNKTASASFKIVRTGFCAGGMWNYVSSTHNILDCGFESPVGTFKKLATNHTDYYSEADVYVSGVCSVTCPVGFRVTNPKLSGYWFNIGIQSDVSMPAGDRQGVELVGGEVKNSRANGVYLIRAPKSVVRGVKMNANSGSHQLRLDDCPGSYVSENSLMNVPTQGIRFAGDVTGIRIGRNYFDPNLTVAAQITQDSASTPKLPVGGSLTVASVATYTNGWAASTYKSGTAGAENTIFTQQNSGVVVVNLRLDATGSTGQDALTLPDGLRPVGVIPSAILVDAVNGARHFCRILTTGVVQVQDIPGTGKPTALYGILTYSVF